jgi:SAM-dependent methyltransferase
MGDGPFFGELYLRSSKPFLAPEVTLAEVDFLSERLAVPLRKGPVLDLGCGHGRHSGGLSQRFPGKIVGLDFDALSLEEARRDASVVRGDFFHLPFRPQAFAGAYCWYNSLFTFDDAQQLTLLRELARCLAPGALLVLHLSNRHRVERQPHAEYDGTLPDGAHLHEEVRFNPSTGRDEASRRLTLPDGRVMAARYFIRYYFLEELTQLLKQGGLAVAFAVGGVDGSKPGPNAADLIVGAKRG